MGRARRHGPWNRAGALPTRRRARFSRIAQLGSTRLRRRTDTPSAYVEHVDGRTSVRFRVSSIGAVDLSSNPASTGRSFFLKPAATTHASRVPAALMSANLVRPARAGVSWASARSRYPRAGMGGESKVWLPPDRVSPVKARDPGPLRRLTGCATAAFEGTRDAPRIALLPKRRDVELRAKKRR